MARNDALVRIQKLLLNRRAELRKRLGMDMQDIGHLETEGNPGDSADVAFDAGTEELASQLAELEARELQQIEGALTKLQQGSYGICEGCGGKIPVVRLKALPYSTLCINCQRELEEGGGAWRGDQMDGWDRVRDAGDPMEDREVDLNDLEIDISK